MPKILSKQLFAIDGLKVTVFIVVLAVLIFVAYRRGMFARFGLAG